MHISNVRRTPAPITPAAMTADMSPADYTQIGGAS